MVCDAAMVLNFVASSMMNGMCCMHSLEEEERRKKDQQECLRKVISVEWQRQRLMEQEQQERFVRAQGLDAASLLADERRRLYIATKLKASQNSSSRATFSGRSQASQERRCDGFVSQPISINDDDESQRTMPASSSPRYNFGENDWPQKQAIGVDSISRSAPTSKAKRNSSQRIPLLVGASSMDSSLFDGESDTDDEFDEVQLH